MAPAMTATPPTAAPAAMPIVAPLLFSPGPAVGAAVDGPGAGVGDDGLGGGVGDGGPGLGGGVGVGASVGLGVGASVGYAVGMAWQSDMARSTGVSECTAHSTLV